LVLNRMLANPNLRCNLIHLSVSKSCKLHHDTMAGSLQLDSHNSGRHLTRISSRMGSKNQSHTAQFLCTARMSHLQLIQAQCTEMVLEMALASEVGLEVGLELATVLVHNIPTRQQLLGTIHHQHRCLDCNSRPRIEFLDKSIALHSHPHQRLSEDLPQVEVLSVLAEAQLVPLEHHQQAKVKESCPMKSLEQHNRNTWHTLTF